MQEKKAIKEEKLKLEEKYMWAILDGAKEKVLFPLMVYVIVSIFIRVFIKKRFLCFCFSILKNPPLLFFRIFLGSLFGNKIHVVM